MACFSEKKVEMMRMGRSRDELKDKCLFLSCKTDDQVAHIAARGVEVKSSNFSSLGKFIFLFTVTQQFMQLPAISCQRHSAMRDCVRHTYQKSVNVIP